MFELVSEGSWAVHSDSDPRWNGYGSCTCGGFVMPSGAQEHIDRCAEEYGDQPDDLEWSYMKD